MLRTRLLLIRLERVPVGCVRRPAAPPPLTDHEEPFGYTQQQDMALRLNTACRMRLRELLLAKLPEIQVEKDDRQSKSEISTSDNPEFC